MTIYTDTIVPNVWAVSTESGEVTILTTDGNGALLRTTLEDMGQLRYKWYAMERQDALSKGNIESSLGQARLKKAERYKDEGDLIAEFTAKIIKCDECGTTILKSKSVAWKLDSEDVEYLCKACAQDLKVRNRPVTS